MIISARRLTISLTLVMVASMSGCGVVAVVDAGVSVAATAVGTAVSVAGTAISTTARVGGAVVDAVLPDGDKSDKK